MPRLSILSLFLTVFVSISSHAADCDDWMKKDPLMFGKFRLAPATLQAQAAELAKSVAVAGNPSGTVQKLNMVPRGSAVLTSSGNLKSRQIEAIIHAASGAVSAEGGEFDPTLKSIADSVKNSILLAHAHGFRTLAIPFIGGRIFSERVGVEPHEIARTIVESAVATLAEHHLKIHVKFVTYGDLDTELFESIVTEKGANLPVFNGSITDYKLHHCRAIVNAANMEVAFGGGLSGIIADETRAKEEIDGEAWNKIAAYYLANPATPPAIE